MTVSPKPTEDYSNFKGTIMKVLHVTKYVVDVFHDQGWENWCRFSIHKGHLKMIAGTPVPREVMQALRKRFS